MFAAEEEPIGPKDIIKGRIAESVVEYVLKKAGWIVGRMGAECRLPTSLRDGFVNTTKRFIPYSTPDFLIWKEEDENKCYWIEVKYSGRGKLFKNDLLNTLKFEKSDEALGYPITVVVVYVDIQKSELRLRKKDLSAFRDLGNEDYFPVEELDTLSFPRFIDSKTRNSVQLTKDNIDSNIATGELSGLIPFFSAED